MSILKKMLEKVARVDSLGGKDPYMRRYFLLKIKRLGSIRVHEILRSDLDRHLHDHPFDFVSLILSGGYEEVTPEGRFQRKPGQILFRRAEDLHRLVLTKPAWTFVITTPWRRPWGFMTEKGWIDEKAYGADEGRHWK